MHNGTEVVDHEAVQLPLLDESLPQPLHSHRVQLLTVVIQHLLQLQGNGGRGGGGGGGGHGWMDGWMSVYSLDCIAKSSWVYVHG